MQGTFVGGDDHRLVLNHVLVNHPSFEHAVQLFTMVHRDLYQPLPMLSFSMEFAVAGAFGLFDESLSGGAWLFHLTNIVLHAVNAVMVWVVVRGLHRGENRRVADMVGAIAAILFAIHPLQVEVIAWVNGRMMLLSTLFGLAALATLMRWLSRGGYRWAVLTVVFVAFCAMSKIRVGLPVLMLLVPPAMRLRMTRGFGLLWVISAAVTGVFVLVNLHATAEAGMFSGAAETLHGPRPVRALLALAWYFQHFAWPVGLASWYPAAPLVRWSDPATFRAMAIVGSVLALAGWSAWRWRAAGLGFVWFFATIATAIQLVPARNTLAADRYMYLPIIGLLWFVANALSTGWYAAARRAVSGPIRAGVALIAVAVAVVLVAQSRTIARFYETPVKKSQRIADIFPDTPHVWERAAWTYYNAGRYEEALARAEEGLRRNEDPVSEIYQVIGASQFRLGDREAAFASLKRALEIDPEDSKAKYQLAKMFEEVGRLQDAVRFYEESIADAPLANPRILRLASLYRRLRHPADARRLYEQVLQNNEFDPMATMALAELDIEVATSASYRAAEERLEKLLGWMSENADAWVNLGVVRNALGRSAEAAEAYDRALALVPGHPTAALNLAVLHLARGDESRAIPLFELAMSQGFDSVLQTVTVHDFLIVRQAPERAVTLWSDFSRRYPDVTEARAFLAWSRALAGDQSTASREAVALMDAGSSLPLLTATLVHIALAEGEFAEARAQVQRLAQTGEGGADARRRLLRALGGFVQRQPDVPWTYCLAARIWIAEGEIPAAQTFADLCEQNCADPECTGYVTELRSQIAGALSAEPAAPAVP